MNSTKVINLNLILSDLAQTSQKLVENGLVNPGPMTLAIIFLAGLLTSLGPCSLSLLPVTIAYLAGFNDRQVPIVRSSLFCSGILTSLVFLGALSGLLGKIYGQLPIAVPTLVAVLAIFMGFNLLGFFNTNLPIGPDPNVWSNKVPSSLKPISAGLAFGLAASPCTTPVLAVLLAWISQSGSPLIGVVMLSFFGVGQIMPLFIAGSAAASIQKILLLKPISRWIPPISGAILLCAGILSLLDRFI